MRGGLEDPKTMKGMGVVICFCVVGGAGGTGGDLSLQLLSRSREDFH